MKTSYKIIVIIGPILCVLILIWFNLFTKTENHILANFSSLSVDGPINIYLVKNKGTKKICPTELHYVNGKPYTGAPIEETKLTDYTADFIQNWLEDNIKPELYDKIDETVATLSNKTEFETTLVSLFNNYIETREKSFTEQLNKLKSE